MDKSASKVLIVDSVVYDDQNPGTSGLRKKVTHFKDPHYLNNFVQAIFDSHNLEEYKGKSLLLGGDGRFWNDSAINIIIKMCAANSISKVYLAENGQMSTPSMSHVVRVINQEKKDSCFGAIILTASHNPGGPNEDFGIKFNNANGAPAPESVTGKIFENTKSIKTYKILDYADDFSLTENTRLKLEEGDFEVEIVSTTKLYVELMQKLFDFDAIKSLFARKDFRFHFDGLHGIAGPYALEIFGNIFGVPRENLKGCDVLPDFGGHHPDPNLTYAEDLVKVMDVWNKAPGTETPDFGAACDGDADRNMIIGSRFFVSPSDSVALIAANYKCIKYLKNGINGVARSMPTSSALDRVARKLNLQYYEVPTGWKFFGNLMDAGKISICGEESFGTGSDHIREKDGIWAILCWLSILAEKNQNNTGKLIGVRDIVMDHWKTYGRDYYCRFDYENLSLEQAANVKNNLTQSLETFKTLNAGNKSFVFEYHDPVDGSLSKNQGWIYQYENGSRIIFRVSGTSSSGATIRTYFEKYVDPSGNLDDEVLNQIRAGINFETVAVDQISKINQITGRTGPTVIT